MLLRVGVAMMVVSIALALVVAAVVALSGPAEEETASQAASVERVSSGAAESEKREFDPGEKLEIDDGEPTGEEKEATKRRETQKTPLPVAADASWPAPSSQEVAAAEEPRYYPQRQDGAMTLKIGRA